MYDGVVLDGTSVEFVEGFRTANFDFEVLPCLSLQPFSSALLLTLPPTILSKILKITDYATSKLSEIQIYLFPGLEHYFTINFPSLVIIIGVTAYFIRKRYYHKSKKYIYHISSGSYELQGPRPTMEDTHIRIDRLTPSSPLSASLRSFSSSSSLGSSGASLLSPRAPPSPLYAKASYYGVYDGHGGIYTANLVQKLLHRKIISRPEYRKGDYLEALKSGYSDTDSTILIESQRNVIQGGAAAVSLLLVDGKYFCANLGDSEALLISVDDKGTVIPHPLSYPHKAVDGEEQFRITSLGGNICDNRVFGTLAITRSFGNYKYKKPRAPANYISPDPYLSSGDLTQSIQYAVLACDGLFDVLTYQEIAIMTHKAYQKSKNPRTVAKELAEYAINILKSSDNVTVIVVKFDWQA